MQIELVGRTGLARILEVSEATTRNWEARGLITPECTVDGRDLFSAQKAKQLKAARDSRRTEIGNAAA
jgi:DNA-binding transcriptional MerR regulator